MTQGRSATLVQIVAIAAITATTVAIKADCVLNLP